MLQIRRNTQTSHRLFSAIPAPVHRDRRYNEQHQSVKTIIALTAIHNNTVNVMTDASIMLSVSLNIISLLKLKKLPTSM